MTQVGRQIGNESNEPGFERKRKFREAGRTVGSPIAAEGAEERRTEGPSKDCERHFQSWLFL